ncbi:hypothetical protein [Streptomyces lancefieldiae]|uniref:Uncharacterized protein n=1 Tax=Streptomyces lancefieldiae TaxID=3075520 RepID=A0ABU3AGU3_9ACTN|nr:hypothetical protein [Streptomyces sp. DSM 40712]MDT0609120.1 hypothetical protein [Streptomyces sp. DSM 40712]
MSFATAVLQSDEAKVWRYGLSMYGFATPHPPARGLGGSDNGVSHLHMGGFMIVNELLSLRPSSCRRWFLATANAFVRRAE